MTQGRYTPTEDSIHTRELPTVNYLAHLYLAGDDPEAQIGSLMGDFVKGTVREDLPPVLRHNILQHRRIDSFTDSHPVVLRSKQRMGKPFRRYGGILVDMFYDHFLASTWESRVEEPLDAYAQRIYALVQAWEPEFPDSMRRSMFYMAKYDLLTSYRSIEGIGRALTGIETRLRRPSELGRAITELERGYDALHDDFNNFLPDLISFVEADEQRWLSQQESPNDVIP